MTRRNKGTVYIVNYAKQFDFEPAKKFGRLKAVTKNNVNIFDPVRLSVDIRGSLKEFNPQHDFLLFCGSTIINVLAVIEVLRQSSYVKCLIYGTKDGKYVPITINNEQDDDDLFSEEVAYAGTRQPELSHHIKVRKTNGKE
jgi:hypothetical protein